MRRHAIYFAPAPGSPLAELGADWLGRCAFSGERRAQPTPPGLAPARLAAITASPRLYGFHATLKAPFALAQGRQPAELAAAVRALARRAAPFALALELGSLDGFLALVPRRPRPELDALAAACVFELDGLRAPPSAAELARRRAAPLTPTEDANLERYGYPYVLDAFRFHMTLTERLAPPEHDAVRALLEPLVEPLCADPVPIDALCVFEQPERDAPFVVRERVPLAG